MKKRKLLKLLTILLPYYFFMGIVVGVLSGATLELMGLKAHLIKAVSISIWLGGLLLLAVAGMTVWFLIELDKLKGRWEKQEKQQDWWTT